jgi:beta-glucosidase
MIAHGMGDLQTAVSAAIAINVEWMDMVGEGFLTLKKSLNENIVSIDRLDLFCLLGWDHIVM